MRFLAQIPIRWLLSICFLLQIAVIGKVVIDYYSIKSDGIVYKFQTQPVDPRDPFRGQYMTLDFTVNTYYPFKQCNQGERFNESQVLFAELDVDEAGFAEVTRVSHIKPKGRSNIIVHAEHCSYRSEEGKLLINLPFSRFYANEFNITEMEKRVNDNPNTTYLNVWVNSGGYAVGDLVIGKEN